MLRTEENRIRAKACVMDIKVYDDAGQYIRTVTHAQTDIFAEDADLIGLERAGSDGIVPIHIAGVETPWTEGDGETTFIWDCKNERGERVPTGAYKIEIAQTDKYGNSNKVVKPMKLSA